ncbi:MAG TPA: glutamine-hydrolyzing carbamoyl-phosphate synthase small subunit, partial [Bacteroidia bacterium]|nr:glutamine-hydrolyzing carbamoyl-phosphate synthase small subunit [Bacteroidia bacterium]
MKYINSTPAVLLLADGTIFHGNSAGKIGTCSGEICFNTGMTGYQEIFTDPSYFGQIMVANHVHIGNYGVLTDESESESIKISGLVCRNFSQHYSRKQAHMAIQDFFVENNIVVICDVDTRALVRHIRDKGAMNAIISSENIEIEKLKNMLKQVPSMEGLELASKVSTDKCYYFGNSDATYKVAVLDLGVKKNSLRNLASRDCYIKVFPWNSSAEEILSWQPNGLLISNGPGDPSVMLDVVKTIQQLLEVDLPLFGICLGHQILAQACGISTYKMFNGHRG